ncbi:MAG: thermonuclease family protein [Candidatus Saccharimonadales bacterium]
MTKRQATKLVSALISIIILLIVFGYQAITNPPIPESPVQPGYYRVTEVADGDTFTVDMNGASERIRLIGVDTPETHHPSSPVQCFGPEASEFTKRTVEGKPVRLEADPIGNNRDRYNRLLRYVYLTDGTLLNQKLITEGYGFAYLSFQFQKQADFAASQADAQDAKRGLWAVCQPKLNDGRWRSNDL